MGREMAERKMLSEIKTIETERLVLRMLDEKAVEFVLAFLCENRSDFTKYEAHKKELYFTRLYQEYVLKTEYEGAKQKIYLRYYIFEKTNENRVIGTVSFGSIKTQPYRSAHIGYKMAVDKKNQGFGTEAVCAAIEAAKAYLKLHRLEAYVMMENLPSMRLLEKCGFHRKADDIRLLQAGEGWHNHYIYLKNL